MSDLTFVEVDGFLGYHVETEGTPVAYTIAVCLLVAVSIAFVAPFACWSSEYRQQVVKQTREESVSESGEHSQAIRPDEIIRDFGEQPQEGPPPNIADITVFHREHLKATRQLVDVYKKEKAGERHEVGEPDGVVKNSGSNSLSPLHTPSYPQTHFELQDGDQVSAVASVASTSRIYGGRKRAFRSRMPWGHAKPLPRQATVRRAMQMERQTRESEVGSHSYNSRSHNSWASAQTQLQNQQRNVSQAAGDVLESETVEGEADYFRRKYMQRSQSYRRPSKRRSLAGTSDTSSIVPPLHPDLKYRKPPPNSRGRGTSGSDTSSIMPPLHPDVISPDDAADAHDPGMIANPTQYQEPVGTDRTIASSDFFSNGIFANILDLAEFDFEAKRILILAIPTTIRAVADPIFRIVMLVIISHFVDTNSMVAYVLVLLFIRLTTEEVSVAITDAETNLLQDALMQGGDQGFFRAGQTIQIAIFCQFAIGVPVLLMWFFFMDNVVNWLVSSEQIAEIASAYTDVIVIDFILRYASKTFMLPFYLTGQARFETIIDIAAAVLTLVVIAIVAATTDLSLTTIGWIQVIIGIAKLIVKVAYVTVRGWINPYRRGLLGSWSFKDTSSIMIFLMQALPLFLGSLFEVGEWDILVLLVTHLGGAEVATWATMGIFWETFAAFTEGLGEAASVRVSLYLTEGMPLDAKRLANKVSFLTLILVLLVASIFLTAGPSIAVALSTDYTLQHLFSELVGMVSLANAPMAFAQVYWSLSGAQGRFSIASGTILLCRWFVIIPIASICIFGYFYDLRAVAGAVALGYAVAAFALACYVFRTDWGAIANLLQEDGENCGNPEDDHGSLSEFQNEEASSSDSSDYSSSSDEEAKVL